MGHVGVVLDGAFRPLRPQAVPPTHGTHTALSYTTARALSPVIVWGVPAVAEAKGPGGWTAM